jgi:hypothetical protein
MLVRLICFALEGRLRRIQACTRAATGHRMNVGASHIFCVEGQLRDIQAGLNAAPQAGPHECWSVPTFCVRGRLRIQAGCTRAAAGQPHEVERLIFLRGRPTAWDLITRALPRAVRMNVERLIFFALEADCVDSGWLNTRSAAAGPQ